MTEDPINIPNKKYSKELKVFAYRIYSENNSLFNHTLFQLLKSELCDKSLKELKLDKNDILSLDDLFKEVNNKEVIARWNDYKFMCIKENKVFHIEKAVEAYLEVYKKVKEVDYINRALTLIKKTKSIFQDQIEGFSEYSIREIKKIESSHIQLNLTKNAVFLDQKKILEELKDYFEDLKKLSYSSCNYTDTKNYIEILFVIKFYTQKEYKIQLALCFEAEADQYNSDKEENTFYPNILPLYIQSLKELKGIKESLSIKNRLERKIKKEQLIYSEMLQRVGIKSNNSLKRETFNSLGVKDFKSGYQTLIALPILPNEKINYKKTFLSQFFKDYIHLNNKGAVAGIGDEETYNFNFSRNFYRNNLISIIREIKIIMDFDKIISKELVYSLIDKSKSNFIPSHRTYLFAEGLYQGFANNFILSTHILLPQIENSLKDIIQQNGRNTTRLTDDIQNDNTLGSILSIDKSNKMLDGICDKDLLLELNNFLIDGNNTNFRNQVCHGLIEPILIDYYGIYLWWLTLKMSIKTEELFKFNKG
ncbi:DUF4209 domain-containing protein [Salegentibacter agarivorans]|jgi:hypothetical protein|uniref:DUF4209 domain-containing protein n=1 Tax=Christiangramia sediminicola TaxID=3073267 RepID=A0ABU1EKU2_9FLAO|nr:DUF4209 domain-containing protein [Christiangramia sp. SM2212]MDR5589010.1 DUF4209 domain-containing protein [Christiangramia sp. SM2212]